MGEYFSGWIFWDWIFFRGEYFSGWILYRGEYFFSGNIFGIKYFSGVNIVQEGIFFKREYFSEVNIFFEWIFLGVNFFSQGVNIFQGWISSENFQQWIILGGETWHFSIWVSHSGTLSSYFFDFPIVRSKIEIDVDQSVTDRDRQEDVLGGETQAEAIWQTEVTDRSRGLKENWQPKRTL